MTYREATESCYCNPFMIGFVLMIDMSMFFVREAIKASVQLHGKEWADE